MFVNLIIRLQNGWPVDRHNLGPECVHWCIKYLEGTMESANGENVPLHFTPAICSVKRKQRNKHSVREGYLAI